MMTTRPVPAGERPTADMLPVDIVLHPSWWYAHAGFTFDEDYERFLLPIDAEWSRRHPVFGIHHCGKDPHRFAASYAKLPRLDFLDLGWGGDVALLRCHLPHTFFNLRLDPVTIVGQTPAEIRAIITRLVRESANPWLTGVCCINLDSRATDAQIDAIFETVAELRREYTAAAAAAL